MSTPAKTRRRIRKIIAFIETLDAYRVGIVANIDQLAIEYRRLELSRRIRRWKDLKKDLEDIALRGLKIPKVRQLIDRDKKMEKYYKYSLVFFALTAIPPFFGITSPFVFITLLVALTLVNVILLYRLYLHDKITYLYYVNRKTFREQSKRIKEDVEKLFAEIRREAKRAGLKTSSFPLKLYNIDYEDIEVVKKPGRLSRQYKVIIRERSSKS